MSVLTQEPCAEPLKDAGRGSEKAVLGNLGSEQSYNSLWSPRLTTLIWRAHFQS